MALEKVFKLIGIISAVASVALYFIGVTLWKNTLIALSVQPSLFPLSLENSILFGYINLASKYITDIMGIVFFLMIISIVILVASGERIIKLGKLLEEDYREWREKNKKSLDIVFQSILPMIGYLIIAIVITITPYTHLKSIQEESILEIMQSKRDTLVLDDRTIEDISIIAINTNYCAYYDGNKSITIPTSKVEQILSKIGNK